MKTIQLFIATLLCMTSIQFAQANTSYNVKPGDPSCHCCKKCDDKKCQEMCAKLDEISHDESKKSETAALAEKCITHCKTAKCDTKKAKAKSCCATH